MLLPLTPISHAAPFEKRSPCRHGSLALDQWKGIIPFRTRGSGGLDRPIPCGDRCAPDQRGLPFLLLKELASIASPLGLGTDRCGPHGLTTPLCRRHSLNILPLGGCLVFNSFGLLAPDQGDGHNRGATRPVRVVRELHKVPVWMRATAQAITATTYVAATPFILRPVFSLG